MWETLTLPAPAAAVVDPPVPDSVAADGSAARASPAPAEIVGDWRITHVHGCSLFFNAKFKRLHAHCCQDHSRKRCKMDRDLAKGPIGLIWSWLHSVEISKDCHDIQKQLLSMPVKYETRAMAREEFYGMITERGKNEFLAIASLEFELRGTTIEPHELPCRAPRLS